MIILFGAVKHSLPLRINRQPVIVGDQITNCLLQDEFAVKQMMFSDIDEYSRKPLTSDLKKAFFWVLNQFPGEYTDYIVVPTPYFSGCQFQLSKKSS